MKKEMPWIRRIQKQAIDATAVLADKKTIFEVAAKSELQKFDDKHAITEKLKNAGNSVAAIAQRADQQHGISDKVGTAVKATSSAGLKVKDIVLDAAEKSGFNQSMAAVDHAFKMRVVAPTSEQFKRHGLDGHLRSVGLALENSYGTVRSVVKPYFGAGSSQELLRQTKNELTHLSACIMQISASEAEKTAGQFGAAIASKITGVATTGALLAVVGTFGSAGTGTAIAGLSGAAATNATLAWVGGLLGGGMAAGAVLSGGVSIIVGLGAYQLLGSQRRRFETLTDVEQRIVQTCWFLVAMIDDLLTAETGTIDVSVAGGLLNNTLLPLQELLVASAPAICIHLDAKHSVAFRQHVLVDFQRVVVDGFTQFASIGNAPPTRSYESVIGGVFYGLLTRTAVDDSIESHLVLEALRRSSSSLDGASEAVLSDYLDRYDADQLKGIANNIKGIYHEELWVHHYNETHDGTYAALFGATNHAGADIEIRDVHTDHLLDSIQLKATDSMGYVREHLERYPDIDVLVTNETAARMDDVHASGVDNSQITGQVNNDLDAIAANTLSNRVLHSAELSASVSAGYEIIAMLRGEKNFPQSVIDTVNRVSGATAATAITAYLFS